VESLPMQRCMSPLQGDAECNRYLDAARSVLGEAAFADECAAGEALTLEQVIDEALAPADEEPRASLRADRRAAIGNLTKRQARCCAWWHRAGPIARSRPSWG
jgi:hypothetical protein